MTDDPRIRRLEILVRQLQSRLGGPDPGRTLTFADGSDGDCVLDGVQSAPFATLAGSTYTMTRDAFANTLTVASGVTLVVAGCRIFAAERVQNSGLIHQNGNSASGVAIPAAQPAATDRLLQRGTPGQAGSATFVTNPSAGQFGLGNGGAGGAGAGGAGGTLIPAASFVTAVTLHAVSHVLGGVVGSTILSQVAGGSGGTGRGDGTNAGGGSGSGGGMVAMIAPTVVNAGTISATGGNGGTPPTGNCGGGGGGGGGDILIYTVDPWTTTTGTANVNGGNGGAGVGTGVAGANGTAGTVLNVLLG